MDVQRIIRDVARAEDGLVEWSRLLGAGLSELQVWRATGNLRAMHDGVWVTGHGRITQAQCWRAATLSSSGSVLSHASAGASWGFRPWSGAFEVITRPGSGGPRRIGDLLVCRSTQLDRHVTRRDGIPVTSPARTLIDLAPHLDERQAAKAVREAIRLKVVTALQLRLCLADHRGRRGRRQLRTLAARYDRLPIDRTRSDAEARALEVLDAVGRSPSALNERIADEEADLIWSDRRRIIEIDGPQWHLDPLEDARKEAVWRGAGWTVDRISSDAVFDAPHELVALARG